MNSNEAEDLVRSCLGQLAPEGRTRIARLMPTTVRRPHSIRWTSFNSLSC